MADEHFQKEPPPPEASQENRPRFDDSRFRFPTPVGNPMALPSFCLGVVSVILMLNPARMHHGGFEFQIILIASAFGAAALILGALGVYYRIRCPTAGGLGFAVSGIVLGLVPVLIFCVLLNTLSHMGFGLGP
jgi:hypothetical protein